MKVKNTIIILVGVFFSIQSHSQVVDTTFFYTLKPIVQKDRTDIEVTLNFGVNSDTAIHVELFRDFYGTPQLYKYITSFKGINGTQVRATNLPDEKLVSPSGNHEVSLRYYISFDPAMLEKVSFAPNFSSSHFHMAACQWMLLAGSLKTMHICNVKIIQPPQGWSFYCSMSDQPNDVTFEGSFSDNFSNYWGGGAYSKKSFSVKGNKLNIFTGNSIHHSSSQIAEAVQKIVRYQRMLFNDFDFPFFTVVILPRKENLAGLKVKNMFMCYVDPGISIKQLYYLMAHEMMHEWLGGKLSIKRNNNAPIFKFHWFTEGFTDYLANKCLLELGIISKNEFVKAINRYMVNIADNQYRDYSLNWLEGLSKNGKYGTEATKLQYYRGALMALQADEAIRKNSKQYSLEHFIKSLYQHIVKGEEISEDTLFNFADTYHLNLREKFTRYIINGGSIILTGGELGSQYKLNEKKVPSFQLGFSLSETVKKKIITDVIAGSKAEKAGLENGMEFINISNENRFGNFFQYERPVSITVSAAGIIKKIEYYPLGESMTILQYSKTR